MRSIVGNINNRSINKIIAETFQKIKNVPYLNYQLGPEKRFEIYCMNNDDTKLVIGLVGEFKTDNKNPSSAILFYNKVNAIQVYNLLDYLNNNVYNSFPELLESSQDEIEQIQSQIDLIKIRDGEEYKNDLELYNRFIQTYYYSNTKQAYMALVNNNTKLQNDYNDLSVNQNQTLKKLSFVLNKYEELENKSKNEKVEYNFIKKLFYKRLNKKNKVV